MKNPFRIVGSFALLVVIAGYTIANSSPVILNPSKHRKIDHTSSYAKEHEIKGVGVGNVIFSSHELPYKNESAYTDIRDTFTWGKDTSLFARSYYPGTMDSLKKMVKSQLSKAVYIEKWARLEVYPEGDTRNVIRYSKQILDEGADADQWDQQRFNLLPFHGADSPEQDFRFINLADKASLGGPGPKDVYIEVFIRFQTGTKRVTKAQSDGSVVTEDEPIFADFLISHGKFKYVTSE
jgi:hypothetical protein